MGNPFPMVMRRLDRVGLAKPLKKPDGQMVVEGFGAREGILEYDQPDGTVWREFVPGETLAASAADLIGLPVTMEHPPVSVTPDNFRRFVVGVVIHAEYVEGDKAIRVRFSVNDRRILDAIRSGKHELSPGYETEISEGHGANSYGAFDATQTARTYNHLAIVEQARGGPSVRARLDSDRCSLPDGQQGHPLPPPGDCMNPELAKVAVRFGINDPSAYGTNAQLLTLLNQRFDSMEEKHKDMEEKLQKKDTELQKKKDEDEETADSEGVERVDMDEYNRMKAEHADMAAKLDALMTRMESDKLKPMADSYGVEVENKDRADGIYRKCAAQILGQPVEANVPLSFVQSIVDRDYKQRVDSGAAPLPPATAPSSGVQRGQALWNQIPAGPGPRSPGRQDSTAALFRPGPSTRLARRLQERAS